MSLLLKIQRRKDKTLLERNKSNFPTILPFVVKSRPILGKGGSKRQAGKMGKESML